jgi:two-component system chemotaxis response regulator CheB
MIRVMIADDSRLVRGVLREILEQDKEISVVSEAANGAEAVERCLKDKPDVVLMDVQMPVMDGIEAVRRIMESCPTPVIVLSASVNSSETRSAFAALNAGAIDAIAKPHGIVSQETFGAIADDIISRIKLYNRVGKKGKWATDYEQKVERIKTPTLSSKIIGIAASTGGPGSLATVLGALKNDFPCPILIVQHITIGFMKGFSEWLARETQLEVQLVEHAMRLEPGVVYLPPDDHHLEVARGSVTLSDSPPIQGCRPSADVLFTSMAKEYGERAVAVVLTGIGSDGAEGASAIRKAGGEVIAQDEETSIVFGMPRAAIERGAATHIAPLNRIPSVLAEIVGGSSEEAQEGAFSERESVQEVLVVDDSPTMRAMIYDILAANGHRVRQAENGRIALEEIAQKEPDLVVLDVMMPELDGYAVCRRLREQHGYIPVLMVTAKGAAEDLVRGLEAGADDIIAKPFEPMELGARVSSLLRIRALHQRLYTQNLELESKNKELERLAKALNRANKELTLLSVTDGLTRAYNHRHFQERFKAEFARAERYGTFLSCVLIDIDHFKKINDTYGHPVGDQVLIRLVEILQESVRKEDLVARYGGEEFVLILPETSGPRSLLLARRIRERVEREMVRVENNLTVPFTVSLGVACYEPNGVIHTSEELISKADAALYRAKENGRNRAELA